MDWFFLAVLSAVFFGVENFFYKTAARHNVNSAKITKIFALTVCILSLFAFFLFRENIQYLSFLLILAFLDAIFFFSSQIIRVEALKKVDASFFYPINKSVGLVFMLLFSFFFLKESVNMLQGVGFVLTLIAIYLLTAEEKKTVKQYLFGAGVVLTLVSTLLAALSNLTLKFAANSGTFAFIFLSYGMGFVLASGINRFFMQTEEKDTTTHSDKFLNVYSLGMLMGVLNFFGISLFVIALGMGPLSIIGTINTYSIVITLILAILIYAEKLTMQKTIGIGLALLALFFLR